MVFAELVVCKIIVVVGNLWGKRRSIGIKIGHDKAVPKLGFDLRQLAVFLGKAFSTVEATPSGSSRPTSKRGLSSVEVTANPPAPHSETVPTGVPPSRSSVLRHLLSSHRGASRRQGIGRWQVRDPVGFCDCLACHQASVNV